MVVDLFLGKYIYIFKNVFKNMHRSFCCPWYSLYTNTIQDLDSYRYKCKCFHMEIFAYSKCIDSRHVKIGMNFQNYLFFQNFFYIVEYSL